MLIGHLACVCMELFAYWCVWQVFIIGVQRAHWATVLCKVIPVTHELASYNGHIPQFTKLSKAPYGK
jgi:hypothetical protein